MHSLQALVEILDMVDGIENHFLTYDEILDHLKTMGRGTVSNSSSSDTSSFSDDAFTNCRIFLFLAIKLRYLSSLLVVAKVEEEMRSYHRSV